MQSHSTLLCPDQQSGLVEGGVPRETVRGRALTAPSCDYPRIRVITSCVQGVLPEQCGRGATTCVNV